MRRRYGIVAALPIIMAIVGPNPPATGAATAAFQQRWQQGEALAPNFWGPLTNATDGRTEPYVEGSLGFSESGPTNPGQGMRLVQYFDKGRMELTHPASGIVTNGLLTTEMLTGAIQVGDATFTPKAPPAIVIAGDPDNLGPTYAGLAAKGQQVLAKATDSSHRGAASHSITATGDVLVNPKPGDQPPAYTLTAYDSPTRHNVAQAFDAYRARVGLGTIGEAISEPFVAVVKVAGTQRTVLIQLFERRVLTFTADNPPQFQVEMGNIGQHYFQWRYGPAPSTPATAAQTASSPPATPTTTPATTASTNGGTTPIRPGVPPASAASCAILYPVKGTAQNGQKVYDIPGSPTYAATKPEICFISPADAEAAGYHPITR